MKIIGRLTINGDKDSDHRLGMNGDTLVNGLANVISTLFFEAVGGNLYLHTASDKFVVGWLRPQNADAERENGWKLTIFPLQI